MQFLHWGESRVLILLERDLIGHPMGLTCWGGFRQNPFSHILRLFISRQTICSGWKLALKMGNPQNFKQTSNASHCNSWSPLAFQSLSLPGPALSSISSLTYKTLGEHLKTKVSISSPGASLKFSFSYVQVSVCCQWSTWPSLPWEPLLLPSTQGVVPAFQKDLILREGTLWYHHDLLLILQYDWLSCHNVSVNPQTITIAQGMLTFTFPVRERPASVMITSHLIPCSWAYSYCSVKLGAGAHTYSACKF